MISICIPVYNFNVTKLVESLLKEAKLIDRPCEIILIDDYSDDLYRKANKKLDHKVDAYIELDYNIGRAAIRNRFLKYANYANLIFLDCDSIIESANFLKTYISYAEKHPNQLICGGRIFNSDEPERKFRLRWKYGKFIESKPSKERNENPSKSFMTNNFLIPRNIFQDVKFEERLKDYGHEDTLFGFSLKKKDVKILHIDNAVLNGDFLENNKFIDNTIKAVSNLVKILSFVNYDKAFIQEINLLKVYFRFIRFRNLIKVSFYVLGPFLKRVFLRGYMNGLLFNYYKLGILDFYFESHGRKFATKTVM